MGEESCELCAYRSQLGAVEKHHVVPKMVTEQTGMLETQSLKLCCNCHHEVHIWYSAKVTNMTYDAETKRFRPKSPTEMVKEYQSAFDSFVKYKKEQKKRTK